ncbi:MAG: Dihydroneopterin aldolase [Verrucomicrobiaceae bacterium]|nr:Dihydroneopterin aldolase [Verrucomicrobiaceae bacterium]
MDIVFIRELCIETIIGIYAWERKVRQCVVLDLEMATDIQAAANSGAIADTLDYHAISTRLDAYVREQQFELLETLAERCAELIRREFAVTWLRLRVAKPTAIASAQAVGVVIERGVKPT